MFRCGDGAIFIPQSHERRGHVNCGKTKHGVVVHHARVSAITRHHNNQAGYVKCPFDPLTYIPVANLIVARTTVKLFVKYDCYDIQHSVESCR